MAAGAAQPPSEPPHEGASHDPAGERAQPQERYGPVALDRQVKDDGRALILYRVAGTQGS
jgi:hypothetical protein